MNNKHKKTWDKIHKRPNATDTSWNEVISLLLALGAEISEGKGSRTRVELNETKAIFHRPHPTPTLHTGLLKALRQFLHNANLSS